MPHRDRWVRVLVYPRLPGIKAVVVALSDNSAVSKLHEESEPRPQCLAGREGTGGVANRSRPDHLHRNLNVASHCVDQLEALRFQESQPTCPRFLHGLQVSRRAVWPQSVGELLLDDIRCEKRIELLRSRSVGQARQVVFGDFENVDVSHSVLLTRFLDECSTRIPVMKPSFR